MISRPSPQGTNRRHGHSAGKARPPSATGGVQDDHQQVARLLLPRRGRGPHPRQGGVLDACVRVALVGIELIAIEIRAVIASVETYLKYAEAVGLTTDPAAAA